MDPPNDLKPVDGGKLPERDVETTMAELKSQIKRLEYGETELRREFPRRESYMSGIQNQLESQVKRLERKEKKLVTSTRQNEQVSSDLESENRTLKDKECQLREDFAFREKQLRHLQNELQSEVTKLKQGEAKTRDESAANDREHQRIQRDLQQRLQDRESDLQQALARRMVDNSPRRSVPKELQIENTQLRNALTSMRADRDAKARDYESEVKELREKETGLQNRLISLRETKESEIREIQDELQRVQTRETGLQNRLTSAQTFDRSQIQDLQNKLKSQKSIHDAEVSSLKKSFRNEKAISTATQEQLARLKESHEAAITSLQQELLAEQESKCKGEGLVSPPTELPSSQRNVQSQSPPLIPPGMPPSTIPSTTIQSRPSFQPPPTTKLPGWYGSPSYPAHQTVPPNPTTTSSSYPSAPYNPSQVNPPAQQTNRGEPQYRPPFQEPTGEIQIGYTPPEQSFSDKNSSGPPQTFTPVSYYPASSPYSPSSATSYNTVPQTPNSINSVPLPSSVSSTTDFRYHVAGSYFPTIGSNQNQAKSTNQQIPERIQPQTGQWGPTVQSSSYQTTAPPQTYIPSQPTDRQRDREGPSEYKPVDKTVWASQPGQSTSPTTSLSHERPEVRETNIGDDEWAAVKAPKAARPTVPQTTGPVVSGPAGQHTKDVQAYTYPPSIVSHSYYGQVDKAATAESTTPYSSTAYTSGAPVLHQSYYATSENKTTSSLYRPSNLPTSNYPPHSVPPSMNPYPYNPTPQMYGTADPSSISQTTSTGGPVPTVSYEARYPTQQYSSSRPPVEQSLLSLVRRPPIRPGGPTRLTKWDPEIHVSSRDQAPHSQTQPLQLEYSVHRHTTSQDENSGVEEDEDGYTEGSDEGDDDMEDEDEDSEGSNEGHCDDDLECLRYIRYLERMQRSPYRPRRL